MITEDYCSYEVAKLLKEKGFKELCNRYYNSQFNEMRTVGDICMMNWNSINDEFYYISIPTHQMAMRWLREVYKLEVRSTYDYDKNSWWGNINPMFEETDENTNVYQKALRFDYQGKSYEEAVEEALKYVLKNLI